MSDPYTSDDIECRECDGRGRVSFVNPFADAAMGKSLFEMGAGDWTNSKPCPACNGEGWRQPTQDELNDMAADAYSERCESKPPMTLDEQRIVAWEQKKGLRA